MRYTVYIFRCLSTGTHYLGVTVNLRQRLEELRLCSGGRRLCHPELLHVEQHDDPVTAQRRLQRLYRQWRSYTTYNSLYALDPLIIACSGAKSRVSAH